MEKNTQPCKFDIDFYNDKLVKLNIEFFDYLNSNIININSQISFSEIEQKVRILINNYINILCEQLGNLISTVDDKELVKYYKKIYKNQGISLITNKKYKKSIITTAGEVTYFRNVLRPKTKVDYQLLMEKEQRSTVVPLDDWLKISNLPFKMTVPVMLEVAEWTATELSYHAASDAILKAMKINLTHETVRAVTDHIGQIVYNNDLQNALSTFGLYEKAQLSFPNKKKERSTLYMEIDGAMLHTRQKGSEPSVSWRENKLGIIFSSDNMEVKKIKDDSVQYTIKNKEYVTYLGKVDTFQLLLFSAAIRNGYGIFEHTVIISDGATWIRHLKDYLFPDAQQILDFWHLSQHIYDFAKLYYNNNASEYVKWAETMKYNFRYGNIDSAIEEIKIMEQSLNERNKLSKEDNTNNNSLNNKFDDFKEIKLSKYIQNNIENINYAEYRSNGWFIGSGHIESGNKSVAQERLKRPGMTWLEVNANHLLALRAKLKSNLWGKHVVIPVLKHYKLI